MVEHTSPTAATSVLRYWLDIEALRPSSVEREAKGSSEQVIHVNDRTILDWSMGPSEDPQQRIMNDVYIGLFDRERIAKDIAHRLGVAEDEDFDVAPVARQLGSLATFRVGPDGKIRKGSFKTSLFALRYETLGGGEPPSAAELQERKIALSEEFDEGWCGDHAPPIDTRTLKDILNWLRDRLATTPALQERPFSIVRQREWGGEDDDDFTEIIDSFFYEDLHRVHKAALSNRLSPALSDYLTSEDRSADERWDADERQIVDQFTVPRLLPAGKWPSRGVNGHPLVLRQQMAVNAAMDRLREGGLFSVNGPPGTGKSTLLRDIIAAVIVERAEAMSRFGDPKNAFAKAEDISIGNRMAPVWTLDPSLCDHAILICSSNNTAVENITRELPDVRALAASYREDGAFLDRIAFFRDVAQAMAGESQEVWGLVSAPLGKGKNRGTFIGKYWPADDNSRVEILRDLRIVEMKEPTQTRYERTRIEAYGDKKDERIRLIAFGAAADELARHYDDVKNGQPLMLTILGTLEVTEFPGRDGETKTARHYRVIKVDPPPMSTGIRDGILSGAGPRDWSDAVAEFQVARENVGELIKMTETLHLAPPEIERLAQAEQAARDQADEHESPLVEMRERKVRTEIEEEDCQRRYRKALQRRDSLRDRRPSFFSRLFCLLAARAWDKRMEVRETKLDEAKRARDQATEDRRKAEDHHAVAAQKLAELTEDAKELEQRLAETKDRLAKAQGAFQAAPLNFKELAGMNREDRERSAIWVSQELDLAREQVFAAAIRLHLAFLRAAGDQVCDNLRLFVDVLRGDREVRAVRAKIGRHLWNTFFMTVPVISSTFASVGRMFENDLDCGDLGWLIVEEGGQAVPQAAVGALWRAKRAVVVGDPKQIEPVVTIPKEVSELLRRQYGDIDHHFDATTGSVQSLSDRCNRLGAYIGGKEEGIWVGCPLRVHRRCNDPMFSISNRISYADKMVLGKAPLDTSGWTGTIPEYGLGGRQSVWFDVRYEEDAWGNVVPGQVAIAMRILIRMVEQRQAAKELTNGKGESLRSLYLRDDGMPAAFVISPFRSVALAMRKEILKQVEAFRRFDRCIDVEIVKKWVDAHIGTIHTFQGKEAETVILVLGGTTQRPQAVAWAGRTANILNVAVTRAKTSLYVVGHRHLWRQKSPYFERANEILPVIEMPDFVAAAPDPKRIERIDTLEGHLSVLRNALEAAKTRVVISSPYLSDRALRDRRCNVIDLIKQAELRNVKILIYIDRPLSTKTLGQEKNFDRARAALIKAGADVILVGRVHAKTLCVDDREITEGSFNWLSAERDEASQYHRLECSFRYAGAKTAFFIERAISLLAERRLEQV